MGKSAPSPPPAPNPQVVAAAQTASNVQTAETQAQLNNVNQNTPYGSLTYSSMPGAGGVPQYTANVQLSPAEQSNLAASQQAQKTYGQIGNAQLGQVASSLSQPINTNWQSTEQGQVQNQLGLIQPQLQQQQNNLNAQLANQGVAQGSDAWNNAQRQMASTNAQTYGNILSNAQNFTGAAIQQQESLRDQPLNEASALLTGSQVAQPSFTQTPQTQVGTTNVEQAYGMQQQQEEANYQSQMANYSGMLGGIGGMMGTLGGAAMMSPWLSDKRLKTDIKPMGLLHMPTGDLPVKSFRYRGDPVHRMGFIAQDVEKHDPAAVVTHPRTGIKGVNYARVLMGAHQHAMGQRRPAMAA